MSKKNVKYTRLTLKKLVHKAHEYGVDIGFTTDMDGKYVIEHTIHCKSGNPALATIVVDRYKPDTVAMAHWFIYGMIAQFRGHNTAFAHAPIEKMYTEM